MKVLRFRGRLSSNVRRRLMGFEGFLSHWLPWPSSSSSQREGAEVACEGWNANEGEGKFVVTLD
jgi:hypothetical protein